MTAPLTTRRHYVNGAPQATLNTGINASATTFALSTGTGWPATPFPLILDFEGAAEEVALITAMSGATVTNCTRGYDGTSAQAHSVGADCVHGIIAKDAEEASQHTSVSAAHGTASPIVGTTDAQTLTNKTVSSSKLLATSTDPGAKLQAAASGSAPQLLALDSAGVTTVAQIGRTGATVISPTDPAVVPVTAKMAAAQTASGLEVQSSAGSPLWLADAKGRIVHRPSDLTSAAVKHVPPSAAAATYLQLRNSADSSDQFLLSVFGEILNAAKVWLRGISTDDPIRYPLDGSKFKVDQNGDQTTQALTVQGVLTVDPTKASNVPATPGATGLKLQTGSVTASLAALTAGGTVGFPTAFGTTPKLFLSCQDVDGTVAVAASFDGLTASGFNYRLTQVNGGSVTRSLTLNWLAVGA